VYSEQWIRDLCEQGIEPHPGLTCAHGSRFITHNENGLSDQNKRFRFFRGIAGEHKTEPITAIFIQEHNLKAKDAAKVSAEAKKEGFLFLIAPIPFDQRKGGAAVLIPRNSIEVKKMNPNRTRKPGSKPPFSNLNAAELHT
jgi:hypothetical protein